MESAILHDRLYHSFASTGQTTKTKPSFPFERINISAHIPTGAHANYTTNGPTTSDHMTNDHMTNPYNLPDTNNYTSVGYNRGTGNNPSYTGSRYPPVHETLTHYKYCPLVLNNNYPFLPL